MNPDRTTVGRSRRPGLPGLAAAAWLAAVAVLSAPEAAPAQVPAPADGFQIVQEGPGLTLHDEMFVLPFTYADLYHGRQSEIVFQLSGKQALLGSRLYFAYTQLSYWQAYDEDGSAPFRNTDYRPELFYRLRQRPRGGGRVGADAGFEHQSNGQRDLLSRSWNQIYVAPHFVKDNLLLRLKLRWRLPEDPKETPLSAKGDDNPDINDFLGHVDAHFYYRWRSTRQVHLMLRGNPRTGRGFASLNLSRQLPRGQSAWLVFTLSHGYGESLADYDRKVSRAGIGVMLAR